MEGKVFCVLIALMDQSSCYPSKYFTQEEIIKIVDDKFDHYFNRKSIGAAIEFLENNQRYLRNYFSLEIKRNQNKRGVRIDKYEPNVNPNKA